MTSEHRTDPAAAPASPWAALQAARRESGAALPADGEPVDERTLSRLKWRCRRGLLENDLFIARFFERHEEHLTHGQARALERLMDLSDNDLLDLLLRRKEPAPELAGTGAAEILSLLRND